MTKEEEDEKERREAYDDAEAVLSKLDGNSAFKDERAALTDFLLKCFHFTPSRLWQEFR